jgi:hypothetical protein
MKFPLRGKTFRPPPIAQLDGKNFLPAGKKIALARRSARRELDIARPGAARALARDLRLSSWLQ